MKERKKGWMDERKKKERMDERKKERKKGWMDERKDG